MALTPESLGVCWLGCGGIGIGIERGVGVGEKMEEEYGDLLYGTTDTAITNIEPFFYLLATSIDSERFLDISGWIVKILVRIP